MLISKTEYERLAEATSLKTIADNTYLEDSWNDNFLWIAKQYYDNSFEKTQLLAMSTWMWKSVVDTVSFYTGTPEIEIDLDLLEYIKDIATLWYFTIWLARIDWELKIKYIPAETFTDENGIFRTYRLYQVPSKTALITKNEYYVLEQQYEVWKNINTLYKVNSFADITNESWYEKVDLNVISQTANLEEIEDTWLKTRSIFLVKNQETKELKDQTSLLKSIKRNVYSVDRKATMSSNQFLQNVESFILLKDIELPTKTIENYNSGAKISFKDLWRVINARDTWSIEFINNNNELLKDCIDYEDNDVKIISNITKIPADFLWWVTTEWAIWQWSRSLVHWAFIKMIDTIRTKLDPLLDELLEVFGKTDNTYLWWDIFAKSDTELAEELKTAREATFVSQLTAIKQYLWLSDEQAEEELERIKSETNLDTNENNNGGKNTQKPVDGKDKGQAK